jgi:hypothetical protein
MKRSAQVQLVLLGSAVGLYACDNRPVDLFRQRYDSLEECRRDWGDPDDCKPVSNGVGGGGSSSSGGSGGSSGAHFNYYGPRYYWDPASGRPVEVRPDGSTRSVGGARAAVGGTQVGAEGVHFGGVRTGAGFVSRGGFGSSARAFGGARG